MTTKAEKKDVHIEMYALLKPSLDIQNKQDGSKYTNHSYMSLYANVHKF